MLAADVAERILAELQYQTAEPGFVQEMAVALFIQPKTGRAILRRSHPLPELLTQRALERLVIVLRVFVDVDLPRLAAGVPASARLAAEIREECGENGQGHGDAFFQKIRNEWLGIRDWGLGVTSDWGSSVSSSRAQPRDLYCPEGISVYELRENDVLVLPHFRQ
ncbi:Uncharacterised protein [Bacteroides xylanisolvens]|nr:Uncharacterised protein [Bacteroides xylanisolvens]